MILADTSIWIDYIRSDNPHFAECLEDGKICIHPFVVGELALGSLRDRDVFLSRLKRMKHVVSASHEEVLNLIETQRIYGAGIGYGDAHLLASTKLTPHARLWTRDKRLLAVAEFLSIAYQQNAQ